MSGQWGYSLGIYKAGPEVPLLGHWLERLAVLVLQGSSRAGLQARGRRARGNRGERQKGRRCEIWVCSASKVLSSEIQSEDFAPLTPAGSGVS